MKLYIVGLGAGDINHITSGAREIITSQSSIPVYIRTQIHPIISQLEQEYMTNFGRVPDFHYMDKYYENQEDFEKVYEAITNEIINSLKENKELIYCTPGNPFVAEITTEKIVNQAQKLDCEIITIPSVSLIDAIITTLKVDPCEHLAIQDALVLEQINPKFNNIITQVYNKHIASQLKLILMENYDDEQEITIVKSAGIKNQEHIEKVKIYEMDYKEHSYDHLTSIYIPKVTNYPVNNFEEMMKKIQNTEDIPQEIDKLTKELESLKTSIKDENIQEQIDSLAKIYKQIGIITLSLESKGEYDYKEIINTANEELKN